MASDHSFSWKRSDLFWVGVSLLVLAACLYYPYISQKSRLPFVIRDWVIVASGSVASHPDPDHWPQVGDEILAIGDITALDYKRDRFLSLSKGFDEEGAATIRVRRGGEVKELHVKLEPAPSSLWERLPLAAFVSIMFWLMGTVVVIFLRPHDERWYVLVLFNFVTALWIVTGAASGTRVSGSAVLFHLVIWLSLPLSVHLHMILPNVLVEKRHRVLVPLYAGSLLLIVLDYLLLLKGIEHILSFVLGVALSLGLLLLRLLLRVTPAVKIANRIMLFGVALGFGPILLFWVVVPRLPTSGLSAGNSSSYYPWITALTLIAIPILPMSYIYAIYKHRLGALEFRANRLLGAYSFLSLCITVYVVILLSVSKTWAPMGGRTLAAVFATSLAFLAGVLFLRGWFQGLVDRYVFGIRHSTEEVIGIVSERIPQAFDRSVLAQVIVDEILPSLLIRQSALYLFAEEGKETLYEQAIPAEQRDPGAGELRSMLEKSKRYLPAGEVEGDFSWVRLVIPLSLQDETIGAWLIGRRDPDDHFPTSDIHLLTTVANQIAPMVQNISLYERAQQEIAQRKAAEQEIRRSEERFRTLFEATFEGIAIVKNGVILEVNQALLAIFGYAPGELIGRKLADLLREGEADLTGVPLEVVGFGKDGSPLDIEVVGKSYLFQGEDVTVVAIRDIAGRKQSEAERKMLQRQLLHSQKMEAIGRLSAGVAHDFNNCLLAIFGYSDLLIDRYGEDAFLCRNATGIKEAGQKAASLTKQLLAFARRQPMEARVMSLNSVVSGLEKMLQRVLGEDVKLLTELDSELPKVKIDPGQIEQVIVNLVVNSRQAMPSGGRLTLKTVSQTVTPESPASRSEVGIGGWAVLTVADTGTGMDAETQARVFEPFFSTKGEGTGLGLSTAYGTVQQNGGHIFVDSTLGEGTCFTIYLPVTQEQEAGSGETAPAAADTGAETILLVEDEDEVRTVLRQILTGKGYRVLQASSGEEALAIAKIHRGVVDLLLTDVTMPRMKGTELALRLLGERPHVRVIYMSGYNEEAFFGRGSTETCLEKPFSPQKLAQTVRAILDAPAQEPRAASA